MAFLGGNKMKKRGMIFLIILILLQINNTQNIQVCICTSATCNGT